MLYKKEVCVLLLYAVCSVCQDERLADVAVQVSGIILEHFYTEVSYDAVSELYRNFTELSDTAVVNGSELVNLIEERIRSRLSQVDSLLQETYTVVDQLYNSQFQSLCCSCLSNNTDSPANCKPMCSTNTSAFIRAVVDDTTNSLTESDSVSRGVLEQQYSQLFRSNVSFLDSAIHVPVDIYEKDPKLKCFEDWTSNLTDHFKSKQEITAQIGVTYQYFGGTLGAVRFFPGRTDWSLLHQCQRCPLRPVDTYHATERPWYVQTVPGRKFLAILLDLSGSMSGFRLLLSQIASVRLLKTLTPSDFFYVVGSKPGLDSLHCSKGLTRATPANVLAISEVIMGYRNQDLDGQVDFNRSLTLIYEEFNNSRISHCHEIIVIFTDLFYNSDKLQLKEMLDRFDWSRTVRVFPFIVGDSFDSSQLREITCQYRGASFHLRYYNDIHEQIINFTTIQFHLLLSPIENNTRRVFWNHYKDIFGSYVLTGSLPYVIKSQADRNDLVGVLGTDINLSWLQESLRQNLTANVNYYSFMIDHTGALIFHPQINGTFISLSSEDDPLSFDIRDFEHPVNSTEFESVHWSMISGETGEYTLEAWIPIERERRYVLRNVTYYYKPIEATPFSVAVVVISAHEVTENVRVLNATDIKDSISSSGIQLGANVSLLVYNQVLCLSEDGCQTTSMHSLTLQSNISVQADMAQLFILGSIQGADSVILSKIFTNQESLWHNLSFILLQNTKNDTQYYLLDVNGYIVTGNQSGIHFSKVWPSLLNDLVLVRGAYITEMLKGYEFRNCRVYSMGEFTGCKDNAGFSVYKGILISLYQYLTYIVTGGIWIVGQFFLSSINAVSQSIFTLLSVTAGQRDNTTLTQMFSSESQNYSKSCPVSLCQSKFTVYELHTSFNSVENVTVTCTDGEQILYSAVRIRGTDVLLVSIDGNCSDSSNDHSILHAVPCPCDNSTMEYDIPTSIDHFCSSKNTTNDFCSGSSETLATNQAGVFIVCITTILFVSHPG